jgi:outer membrane receptor protein involved in Fe transport
MAPYRIEDYYNEVVSIGNPELNSMRSTNIDLLYEHYFANIGLLSGGVFYKDILDFTFTESRALAEGVWNGLLEERPVNGDDATVYGAEVAWQQRFDFLPDPFNGAGLYFNYTFTHSEADYGNEVKYSLPRQVRILDGQVEADERAGR